MKVENILRVMEVLCTGIPKGYNINQVSRLSGIDVATTYRTLKRMEAENEVLKEKAGNNLLYCPNLRNLMAFKYCEMASIARRKRMLSKNTAIAAELLKLKDAADSLVVFGSVARGEPRPNDVDILLLFSKKKPITGIQKSMPPRFSPVYMGLKEFSKKIKDGEQLALDIIRDAVVVSGEGRYLEAVRDAYEKD